MISVNSLCAHQYNLLLKAIFCDKIRICLRTPVVMNNTVVSNSFKAAGLSPEKKKVNDESFWAIRCHDKENHVEYRYSSYGYFTAEIVPGTFLYGDNTFQVSQKEMLLCLRRLSELLNNIPGISENLGSFGYATITAMDVTLNLGYTGKQTESKAKAVMKHITHCLSVLKKRNQSVKIMNNGVTLLSKTGEPLVVIYNKELLNKKKKGCPYGSPLRIEVKHENLSKEYTSEKEVLKRS